MAEAHPAPSDENLLAGVRAGDEDAFMTLVERYGPLMLRVALMYVSTRAVAEDVVQDAWLGFLQGLDRFEGRASLKTWLVRITANQARSRGARERRSVPLSSLAAEDEPAVDPERFRPTDGAWSVAPAPLPEERLLAEETLARVREAIAALPPRQQEVILLRDVEGWEPEEVNEALGITDGNQRVLLHRARARVRDRLERYLEAA